MLCLVSLPLTSWQQQKRHSSSTVAEVQGLLLCGAEEVQGVLSYNRPSATHKQLQAVLLCGWLVVRYCGVWRAYQTHWRGHAAAAVVAVAEASTSTSRGVVTP